MQDSELSLTSRQREILRHVVEEYVATRQPVGSRALVERAALGVSPSTVRSELATLEADGLLTHPHTSAGRVPTERGYRLYAGGVLERLESRPGTFPLDLTSVRHVEVLLIQPRVVMVVVITSTGGVTKRTFAFQGPVDPGLAQWAGEYLKDRVGGLTLGANLLRQRLSDPELPAQERSFLEALSPAFTEALGVEQRLYVGGTASLLDDVQSEELASYRRLLEILEKRAALLELVRGTLDPRRPFVRVGEELAHPELTNVALVGAAYGLTNRPLGTVGLLGPVRMDYDKAIRSVH